MRRLVVTAQMGRRFGVVVALGLGLAACGQAGSARDAAPAGQAAAATAAADNPYAPVQAIFDAKCQGCHPGQVPSLDLTAPNSYSQLVGIRATELPELVRVIAGDPDRSFLYTKVIGREGLANHEPGIGGRMPFGSRALSDAEMATIRTWIENGAKGTDGKTRSADEVATPGSVPPLKAAWATSPDGTGTITGTVYDDSHKPLAGAIVTELIVGKDQPQNEEHYRAAITDANGKFTLAKAGVGRILLKAYAPNMIYTSYIVDVAETGETAVEMGLSRGALDTPTIANPTVDSDGTTTTVSMDVSGPRLDKNYTLAINPDSGRVVEIHGPAGGADETPGRWTSTVDGTFTGKWIFVAVDHRCNSSGFLTVG